jgi:hypothetical protein
MTAGTFWRYWHAPPPPPEEQALDRTALRQIIAALIPTHAQALAALAGHGDYEAAATALGESPIRHAHVAAERGPHGVPGLVARARDPTRTWRHSRHAKDRAPHGDLASLAGATVTLVGIADAFGTSDAATGSTTSPPRSPNSPQTSQPCRPT